MLSPFGGFNKLGGMEAFHTKIGSRRHALAGFVCRE